jgi:hypothetical protein
MLLIVHQCFLMTLSRKIIVFKRTLQVSKLQEKESNRYPRFANGMQRTIFPEKTTVLGKIDTFMSVTTNSRSIENVEVLSILILHNNMLIFLNIMFLYRWEDFS